METKNLNNSVNNKHYFLKIKNIDCDVIDIVRAISNKLINEKKVISNTEFNYFFQATKYLLRCFFKKNEKEDLKKCISEINKILEIENEK